MARGGCTKIVLFTYIQPGLARVWPRFGCGVLLIFTHRRWLWPWFGRVWLWRGVIIYTQALGLARVWPGLARFGFDVVRLFTHRRWVWPGFGPGLALACCCYLHTGAGFGTGLAGFGPGLVRVWPGLALTWYHYLHTGAGFGPGLAKSTKPSQAKPGQAKPSQAKPGQAEPSQAKPSRAKSGQAKPSQAKPGQAKPNLAKPGPNPAPVCT